MKKLLLFLCFISTLAEAQVPDIAPSRVFTNAAAMTTNSFLVGPATNGGVTAISFRPGTNADLWFSRFVNSGPGVVSNTTAETSIINTNATIGRSQGIQPDEMVAGRNIRFHFFGFTTQTTGQNIQYRVEIGGTTVLDTGSSAGFNVTSGAVEFYGMITFVSTTQCRGWMDVKFQATGDKPANTTTLTTYATVDNSAQQQIKFTLQSNNTATVWQTTSAIVEFF